MFVYKNYMYNTFVFTQMNVFDDIDAAFVEAHHVWVLRMHQFIFIIYIKFIFNIN